MTVRRLGAFDHSAIERLVDADPYANHLLAARLRRDRSAELWGIASDSDIEACIVVGGALYPSRLNSSQAAALGSLLPTRAFGVGSIAGERDSVLGLWGNLEGRWPVAARLIRARQPFMILTESVRADADPAVQRARLADLAAYTAAGAMMFASEIGLPAPMRSLQQRYRTSIKAGMSFAAASEGRVYFKCDIGFVLGEVAHLQGVWLAPELRGQGKSAGLLAGALQIIQAEIAPQVSLYVNDFNSLALALYRRLGFSQVAEYATVFF